MRARLVEDEDVSDLAESVDLLGLCMEPSDERLGSLPGVVRQAAVVEQVRAVLVRDVFECLGLLVAQVSDQHCVVLELLGQVSLAGPFEATRVYLGTEGLLERLNIGMVLDPCRGDCNDCVFFGLNHGLGRGDLLRTVDHERMVDLVVADDWLSLTLGQYGDFVSLRVYSRNL